MREGGAWQLYDMVTDPAEATDLAGEEAAILAPLAAAFDRKFSEVTRGGLRAIPTEIGHPEAPAIVLPGHEGLLRPEQGEGIDYADSHGWANDWIDRWTSRESFVEWPIKVVAAGNYAVSLDYTAPETSVGTRVVVSVVDASAGTEVEVAHDPAPLASYDRVPRKEVPAKDWANLPVGILSLEPGTSMLQLRAAKIVGGAAPAIKAVRLRRIPASTGG